ncbi:hypothetical protein B4145_2824 [Bacillus subtilis]|uniref:Uncharacterized protein n=1 Tax=Bacillus subtilis subsp. subtilis TaxID=135461 RepID=A0ABD3ZSV3_BACIU|nr:hypothetical protein B4067_2940 [Bacillus subtilis subsp. subtilis]KIN52646.1 hypothetical protein B4145_2824 [Bacillus subtilis]
MFLKLINIQLMYIKMIKNITPTRAILPAVLGKKLLKTLK